MRAILNNPRYTGHAFFGRWSKHETPCSIRSTWPPARWSGSGVARADRVVGSRQEAHPAIVSVETFTQAQLLRRSHTDHRHPDVPAQRLVRCALCSRKMQGAVIRKHAAYYRCHARAGVARSCDRTARGRSPARVRRSGAVERVDRLALLRDAEKRLRRFQDAIAAGIDPSALVDAINEAQAQRAAARADLNSAPARTEVTDAEVYAMIDSLGDVGAALTNVPGRAFL